MTLPAPLLAKARQVMDACTAAEVSLALAESCTGGLVAAALTSLSGSSAFVERGFVTYSNAAKTELLTVPAALIAEAGAVSEAVARAMAEGALANSAAGAALAITGIAGPTGGSPEKPVGTVHIAAAARGRNTLHRRLLLPGNRDQVREAAVIAALDLLMERIVV
ncbi:MAG TPA: CinA family protein [Rhodospirillaceae bacterium]|nr:CinA family protein [Rhodospirillaceae bacterium]